MAHQVPDVSGDLDSFHVEETDRARVVAALDADCASEGLGRVPPGSLVPFGRWFHGDEDPAIRRFLVAPSGVRWTTILPSTTDWEHEWCSRIAAALQRRAAYLMLHDHDVFSLHLFDGRRAVLHHVSSPDHFDFPAREPGELERDVAAFLRFCGSEDLTEAQVHHALAPPGRVDVDGRLAFERTADLLELPPGAAAGYRLALAADGLTPRPEYAGWLHLAYREGDEDEAETEGVEEVQIERLEDEEATTPSGEGGVVVPFPRRR